MDDATLTRIDNYCPQIDGGLSGDALDVLRDAVRRAEPGTPQDAALLLHAGARHVRWAVNRGVRPTLRRLFAADVVAESIREAERRGMAVSPFRARVTSLAYAVTGRRPRRRSSVSRLESPYSPSEQSQLVTAAAALRHEEAMCLRVALALGLGAGVTGSAATAVTGAHVRRLGGHVVVAAPGVGPVVVREPWGQMVAEAGVQRPDTAVTTYYTTAGRQRVQRGTARMQEVPRFSVHRLRTTWIVDLLSCDVPIDAVAGLAGMKVESLHPYAKFLRRPDAERLAWWLAGTGQVAVDSSPFVDLQRDPAKPSSRSWVSAAAMVDSQRPQDPNVADVWATSACAPLRELVLECASDGRQAKRLLTALFVLLEWAITEPGLPLDPAALLKETTLGRWATRQRAHGRDEGSIATYRAALRHLRRGSGSDAGGTPTHPRPGVALYTDAELATLAEAADPATSTLPPRLQRVAATYLHGQLGAGLAAHETAALRSGDVWADGQTTWVRVDRAGETAVLPVADEHAPPLRRLADESESGMLTGYTGTRRTRQLRAIDEQLPVTFSPTTLQAHWLHRAMRRGVPADVLSAAKGLSLAAIAHVSSQLPDRPLAELVAWSGHA